MRVVRSSMQPLIGLIGLTGLIGPSALLVVSLFVSLCVACQSVSASAVPPEGVHPDAGGPDGGSDAVGIAKTRLRSLDIRGIRASGDFRMSGRLSLQEDKLRVAVAAIRDPDDAVAPLDPGKVTFSVSTSPTRPLTCIVGRVGVGDPAAVDLVFINDTTGSMAGTVHGMRDSVKAFTDGLAMSGIDARYAMYTYGDAYATKLPSDTRFKIGRADFEPPPFDSVMRPYVGLSDPATFDEFLTELDGCPCLGAGGGDAPENTLGALAYANQKVAWRDGAARMFVAIGDNPSHQRGSTPLITSTWEPPKGDELVAKLDGTAVVHVIGHDIGGEPYYDLELLAEKTGGMFMDLPPDGRVDLKGLQLQQWLTQSFTGVCADPSAGTFTMQLTASVGSYTGTLTFDVVIE